MRLTCLECKNDIDLSTYSELNKGSVVECNYCGITLEIKELSDDITAEIVDEGK